MATTFIDYTGDGNNNKTFTFPSYQKSDVKVEVDNVVKTPSTHYNITNYTTTGGGTVEFTSGNIPASGISIRIYRDTDISTASGEYDPKATFQAGSSVRSVDLNNNQKQALYAIAEEKDQTIITTDIKDGAVTSAKIYDGTIVAADIANTTITGSKLVNDTITSTQIAADAIGTSELADNSVASANIIDGTIVNADLNANLGLELTKLEDVNSSKIIVGNSSNKAAQVDMSGDVTITNAGVTTIGADAVQIGNISDTETTLTANSDAKIPTSKAVADHVVNVVNSVGGFVIVADKDNFPASHPDPNNDAGTVLSITNPNGLTVSSNTSSNGTRTGGSSTVTINSIPTSAGATLSANYTMLVQTTSTEHTYDFYKFLAKDGDVLTLSDDINDFAARYRVAATAPVTGLCAANGAGTGSYPCDGDMYFNTSDNKMYVFGAPADSTSTSDLQAAWAQVTSTGEFKSLTVKTNGQPHDGTLTFDGSATQFDLFDGTSAASVTNKNQLLVVLNGVVQKSNAGSWSSSNEGFHMDGTDGIKFCTAPPADSTIFVTLIGSAVSIPTPGDETVTEAKLNANAPTNDHVLTADSTAAGGFKWAAAAATVGGANGADFNDDVKLRFGTGNDMEIYTASNNSGQLRSSSGIGLTTTSGSHQASLNGWNTSGTPAAQISVASYGGANTGAKLYYNATEKLQTTADGIGVSGGATFDGDVSFTGDASSGLWDKSANSLILNDNAKAVFGTGNDLEIFHDASDSIINDAGTGNLKLQLGGATKAEVVSGGFTITGTCTATSYAGDGSALTGVAAASADGCMYKNDLTISNAHTIAATEGAHSVGPITLNATVTVNGRWVIS